ncbi:MAG: DUF1800 family protein [Verrucomicrobiota bacterium]
MRTTPIGLLTILIFSIAALPNANAFVDSDVNGLDDAWEMIYFGTLGNDPAADPDGDSCNNLEECNAATNPLDSTSCLIQVSSSLSPSEARLFWKTMLGKKYRIQFSPDLSDWSSVLTQNGTPVDFMGNGGELILDLSDPANPLLKGGATREVWLATGASANVNNFKTSVLNWTNSDTPAAIGAANPPSGSDLTIGLQAPSNYAEQYGQRLRGYICAPETGDYTFYIAGRHQSEFWLSSDNTPANLARVLRQTTGSILLPEDWTFYATNGISPDAQKSAAVSLTEGELYYFEVIQRHNTQEDHLAVGWTKPSDNANDIEVIPGEFVCPDIDLSNTNAATILNGAPILFTRVSTFGPNDGEALDTDGDGIQDGIENLLPGYSAFDANSSGSPDGTDLANALAATEESISVTTSDGAARENTGFAGNGLPRFRDVARFTITRSGSLKPVTVFYSLGGSDGMNDGSPQEEEDAESSDYDSEGSNGEPLAGTITIPAGANSAQIIINPSLDTIHEYPETVSLTVSGHPDYSVDGANSRSECRIFDERNDEENEILFVGFSLPQPGSATPKGSAICSGKLSANKDQLTLFSSITASFSAPQNNSHVHKDEGTPGSDPVTFSLPQVGEIGPLDWPLHDNGGYTPQKMIDSLFNQVNESTTPGESKLYVNWHTNTNPGGELYAFLSPATGSVEPPTPDDPPAIIQFDPVTQETELRREIVRFLTHATFGPTPALIDDLYNRIVAHATNDRIAVFSDWIDEQLDQSTTPQTSVLAYAFAADWQEYVHRGYYDPTFYEDEDWGSDGIPNPPITAPALPPMWAYVQPHNPDANNYALRNGVPEPTYDYPLSNGFIQSVRRNSQLGLGYVRRESVRRGIWTNMMNGHDQLRQRLAFAWSQVLVISAQDAQTRNRFYGRARYWDMLAENCDDDFREMLEGVTYSPMMGQYLSHLKNRKEADLDNDGIPDVFADENYAREIMQLFSIGLVQLHLDGTLALSSENGLPQPTYNNNDIQELAKIMTGMSFGRNSGQTNWDNPANNNNFNRGNGNQYYGSTYEYPMNMFGGQHDLSAKTIVGNHVVDNTNINNTTDHGHADLADVHDWLAGSGAAPYDGYPSTPSFIARRLIQRLITSNPPREYVYRVAKVFDDTGGDLKETARAILLDYHARSFEVIDDTYGRKKPPLMAYVQLSRALGATTDLPISELGNDAGDATDYGLPAAQRNSYTANSRFRYPATDTTLSMSPMRAETVFNFYLPEYSPGGGISAAGMVGPEFQILNETSIIQNVNYFRTLTWSNGANAGQGTATMRNATYNGYGSNADHNQLDRDTWIAKYNAYVGAEWERDQQLIDELDDLLNAGWLQRTFALDPANRGNGNVADPDRNPYESIIDALTESYGTSANNIRDKVRLAFYLMTTTSPFQVQK